MRARIRTASSLPSTAIPPTGYSTPARCRWSMGSFSPGPSRRCWRRTRACWGTPGKQRPMLEGLLRFAAVLRRIARTPPAELVRRFDELDELRGGYLEKRGWFESYRRKRSVAADGSPLPWLTYPFIDFIE